MAIDAKQDRNFLIVDAIDETKGSAEMIIREEVYK
jgi:hypothetical protein